METPESLFLMEKEVEGNFVIFDRKTPGIL